MKTRPIHIYVETSVFGGVCDDAFARPSIADCAAIVSWNFKHIVNLNRIPLYNAINAVQGYRSLEIRSPLEVIER